MEVFSDSLVSDVFQEISEMSGNDNIVPRFFNLSHEGTILSPARKLKDQVTLVEDQEIGLDLVFARRWGS